MASQVLLKMPVNYNNQVSFDNTNINGLCMKLNFDKNCQINLGDPKL